MSNNNGGMNIPPSGNLFNDLVLRIKLVFRLLTDSRISPWLKVLPVGSLLYFLIPDILPGPIDDVAVVLFGINLFIELCPKEIVQEHLDQIQYVIPAQKPGTKPSEKKTPNVVDGEFRDK